MSRKRLIEMRNTRKEKEFMKKQKNLEIFDYENDRSELKNRTEKEKKSLIIETNPMRHSVNMKESMAFTYLATPTAFKHTDGSRLNLSTCQSSKSTFFVPNSKKMEDLNAESPTRRRKNLVRVKKLFEAVKKDRFHLISASLHIFDKNDVNEKDSQGNVPLYYTTQNGNLEFSRVLISKGARVNEVCSNDDTPMHMACHSNNFDLIILLVSHKGSMNFINKNGLTPLAFLNEKNLEKLNLVDGIVSVENPSKGTIFNNDSKFFQKNIKKDFADEFLMHTFQPTVHHYFDVPNAGSNEKVISSFRILPEENCAEKKSTEFMEKLRKVTIESFKNV